MDLPKKDTWSCFKFNHSKMPIILHRLVCFYFFFRKGSIIAVFQLTFKVKVTAEVALNPLKKETADGRLGSLKVDRGSLKETDAKKGEMLHVFFCVLCVTGGHIGGLT